MVSYNLAIKRKNSKFYEQADIIRLNSPWYTEKTLIDILKNEKKPKFLDINIKSRSKPKLTEHDYKRLLEIAGKYNIDWVGISNVEDVDIYDKVRKMLGNNTTKICAKIETKKGCLNDKQIIKKFDGVMVDVEDLAYEIGWEEASDEKDLIYALCEQEGKDHFRLAGVIFEHKNSKDDRVVYSFGAWDLLHPGHIRMLERAKALGNKLVVGVVGDNAVSQLKGVDRPIQPLIDRLRIVGALRCVDEVMVQDDYDPIPNMKKVKPDILVKGDDWDFIPGEDWIREHGEKLVKPSYSGEWSTSKTVKKIRGE